PGQAEAGGDVVQVLVHEGTVGSDLAAGKPALVAVGEAALRKQQAVAAGGQGGVEVGGAEVGHAVVGVVGVLEDRVAHADVGGEVGADLPGVGGVDLEVLPALPR